MAALRLEFAKDAAKPIELREGVKVTLGRSPACAGVIEDTDVSREHATVEHENGRTTVEDLKSRNGTFVNGAKILGRIQLRPGDVVRLGPNVEMRVVDPEAAKPAPAPAPSPDASGSGEAAALSSGSGPVAVAEPPAPAKAPPPRRFRPRTGSPTQIGVFLGILGVSVIGGLMATRGGGGGGEPARQPVKTARATPAAGSSGEPDPQPTGEAPVLRIGDRPGLEDEEEERALTPKQLMARSAARTAAAKSGAGGTATGESGWPADPAGASSGSPPKTPPASDPKPEPRAEPKRVAPPAAPDDPWEGGGRGPGSGGDAGPAVNPFAPPPVAGGAPTATDPELDAMLAAARDDPKAKAELKKRLFVVLRHDGALTGAREKRALDAVRARLVQGMNARIIPASKLEAVRDPALGLKVRILEVRSHYTQDYGHGLGRAIEKTRLAPHPKALKVDIVDVGGDAPKPLESFAASTPALKPTEPDGFGEQQVWDATLEALEAVVGRWNGKL